MDQVSPALQYSTEKVETCSWESSSPQSLKDSALNTSTTCPLQESASSPADPEVYSVHMAVESNPSESRDSTAEPATPANMQGVQEQCPVLCKEEGYSTQDYSCAVLEHAETGVKTKEYCHPGTSSSSSSLAAYEGFQNRDFSSPIVNLAPPPLTSASAAESQQQQQQQQQQGSEPADPLPPTLSFGTYVPPEKQNKKIVVTLEGAELWHQFYQAGTEMIITKSGRQVNYQSQIEQYTAVFDEAYEACLFINT